MAHQVETSSSRPKHHDRFDVFLNFRGPDSRHTVADVLHESLTNAGFGVFFDDEAIRKGEVIEGRLLSGITNSRIYILIFSRDYASSKWCLRELTKIMEFWRKSRGSKVEKVILPVFYNVEVSKDLKLRSNLYLSKLQDQKAKVENAEMESWMAALKEVTKIKGWNLENHG